MSASLHFQVRISAPSKPVPCQIWHRHLAVKRPYRRIGFLAQCKSRSHSLNYRFLIVLHSPDGNHQTGPPVSPLRRKAPHNTPVSSSRALSSESGFSVKYAELRAFHAISKGKPQSFSAVETRWRREMNSNFRYLFAMTGKLPIYRHLQRITTPAEKRKTEILRQSGPLEVRFARPSAGEYPAIRERDCCIVSTRNSHPRSQTDSLVSGQSRCEPISDREACCTASILLLSAHNLVVPCAGIDANSVACEEDVASRNFLEADFPCLIRSRSAWTTCRQHVKLDLLPSG